MGRRRPQSALALAFWTALISSGRPSDALLTCGRRRAPPRVTELLRATPGDGEADGPGPSRRNFLGAAPTAAALAAGMFAPVPPASSATAAAAAGTDWPLGRVAFSLLPLAGTYTPRITVQTTIVKDTMWTLDQIQGVVNVNVPVRMTVIKLQSGGLWIHNPVAPTAQLLGMVDALVKKYGPVRHLVLGSAALEHKATFGPFASAYPDATVWIQPGQWAFPASLPIELLGVKQRGPRRRMLPDPRTGLVAERSYEFYNDGPPSWTDEIEYETLGPLRFKSVGTYSESAFYHKATNSLIVTDCVIKVTETPPAVIDADPRAMLFHARDNAMQEVEDTPKNRKKGWRRMAQFGLVFFPSQIDVMPLGRVISDARNVPDSSRYLGEGAVPFNLYPWAWRGDSDVKSFEAIVGGGKLFCPPILTKLILDREPRATLEFVDRICQRFPFTRVVPCHLDNDVAAGPAEFRQAFAMLTSDPLNGRLRSQRPLGEDLALLQKASDLLTDLGVVGDSLVCDAEPARIVGRFADVSKAKR